MDTVSADYANRHFSALLRRVAQGERVTVTARGKPVATLAPVESEIDPVRGAARQRLLQRLVAQVPSDEPRAQSRSELYD